MDYEAKLYIIRKQKLYRIKVFENTVGIERQQPHDSNLLFDNNEYPVYVPMMNVWDMDDLDRLISAYETAIAKENEATE